MNEQGNFRLFSEMYGSPKKKKKLDQLDKRSKGRLWNFLSDNAISRKTLEYFWSEIFCQTFESFPTYDHLRKKKTSELFVKAEHEQCFDCIQYYFYKLWQELNNVSPLRYGLFHDELDPETEKKNILSKINDLSTELNKILEEEGLQWRFNGHNFVPVTNEIESDSVTKTCNLPSPFNEANNHIQKAIELIRDQDKPDYSNSIKESISAVEAAVQAYTNSPGLTFSKSIDKLAIHPSLKESWKRLYGFTSDEGGIRHAKNAKTKTKVDFSLAQYFIVTCSAMVNYFSNNYIEQTLSDYKESGK
ncbi:MAG TPA: hypothetical protein PKW95_16755 [bacterium]|nr:hypothetical protein [bacterium]